MKFSIKPDIVRPLESPSMGESVFRVTLDRPPSVSPVCSGLGVSVRVEVGAGAGTGTGARSGAGVGINSGFGGAGGGETKAVLSAFSFFARASAAASLSAFCCFKMRSTAGKSSQAGQKGKGAS